ncbi:unannotated protein [freshwater metagenome]|uniref:Unannotated protein n=1 Tax=freshwater metagenome TaxID=449393 RepID=A0A6J7NBW8_9ZZZZ
MGEGAHAPGRDDRNRRRLEHLGETFEIGPFQRAVASDLGDHERLDAVVDKLGRDVDHVAT